MLSSMEQVRGRVENTKQANAPFAMVKRFLRETLVLREYEHNTRATPTRGLSERPAPPPSQLVLGEMRCLHALAEWEHLSRLCREFWPLVDAPARAAMAPLAAQAAWNMSLWDDMEVYVRHLDHGLNQLHKQDRFYIAADHESDIDARSSLGAPAPPHTSRAPRPGAATFRWFRVADRGRVRRTAHRLVLERTLPFVPVA